MFTTYKIVNHKHKHSMDSEINKAFKGLNIKSILHRSNIMKQKGYSTANIIYLLVLLPFLKHTCSSFNGIYSCNYFGALGKVTFNFGSDSLIVQDYINTGIAIIHQHETKIQTFFIFIRQHKKSKKIFDIALATSSKDNKIFGIYTANNKDFETFSFLEVINPLL